MTAYSFRFLLPVLALSGCAEAAPPAAATAEPALWSYKVVKEYPHDPAAFTQGLFWLDGSLWESTGMESRSTIRQVRLEDGKVLRSVPIPAGRFGEGSAPWGKEIISLTWQHGEAYRWDRATFRQTGTLRYLGEGWGLTQNGRDLIMSDGSAELHFLDPATFKTRRSITVTAGGQPVQQLNELEWVKGEIFANVWMTGRIARIDPATGVVKGWIDLERLALPFSGGDPDAVLNGIAYDAARDRLFVTGKNWPKLFEIKLTPPAPATRR
ncbi:MAG TPA: glutaminyl-peptide cyclotransferase [Allosphingosinicella sp.]|jgi:glutamine cyclotransferase